MEGTTEPVVAVVGHPIAGNPTQFALEKGLHHGKIDCRVLSIDLGVDSLPTALAGMGAMRFQGVWVGENARQLIADCLENLSAEDLDALELCTEDPAKLVWTPLNLKQDAWQSVANRFAADHALPPEQIRVVNVQHVSQLTLEIDGISENAGSSVSVDVEKETPPGIVLAIEENADDSAEELKKALNTIASKWTSASMVIDLGQSWDGPKLAAWDRFKASSPTVCLRRVDVHALCLANLVELWFGNRVSPDIFQEALDEYLAV